MGINLFKHKGMSFIISCFFTGVAGGLLAVFMRSIDSKTFQVALTYDILLIVILGGLGSITGSIVGSFLMTAGREWLRFFDNPLMIGGFQVPLFRNGFRMVIFSMILMAVVLYYRKGLMGNKEFTWDGLYNLYHKLKARFRRRTPGKGDQGNV
jgi:branched-chain amino acid transport system permease protein